MSNDIIDNLTFEQISNLPEDQWQYFYKKNKNQIWKRDNFDFTSGSSLIPEEVTTMFDMSTTLDGKKVLGSNKPIIVGYDKSQRAGQKTFTSEVTEYIFRITSNADRKILDEAVPGWGEEGKDLAQSSSLEEFRLKVNSTRRTKTLVRLTLGGELSTIRIPDRTPGVVLKAQEFLEGINKSRYSDKNRQSKKLEIIDKILTNSSEPLTVREILERWRGLANYAGRPYKNIPTTNELPSS